PSCGGAKWLRRARRSLALSVALRPHYARHKVGASWTCVQDAAEIGYDPRDGRKRQDGVMDLGTSRKTEACKPARLSADPTAGRGDSARPSAKCTRAHSRQH